MSVQNNFKVNQVDGMQEKSNPNRIKPGCPNINYKKFTRPLLFDMRFCIDQDKDYKLEGNF